VKRGLIIFAVILLLLASLGAALFFGLGFWLSPQDSLAKSDAIVAISGGETTSRAEEAVRLYKEGWAPLIIFSGAALDPTGPSNAQAMKTLAIAQGVPADAIIIDEVSTTTTENADAVAKLTSDRQLHQIILVTSPYHQRRASVTFERALGKGVAILNHSTTDQAWRRAHWWATDYSRQLTISELQKTLYVIITNRVSS
jgi:uncharacterized SAM-binding protein YcdF (DUF218 family)